MLTYSYSLCWITRLVIRIEFNNMKSILHITSWWGIWVELVPFEMDKPTLWIVCCLRWEQGQPMADKNQLKKIVLIRELTAPFKYLPTIDIHSVPENLHVLVTLYCHSWSKINVPRFAYTTDWWNYNLSKNQHIKETYIKCMTLLKCDSI